ncbi:hypothetical protein FRC17_009647 [Serendipita sp. 399]|nr:hypothetical protein FRC17_009647 [Serendipita sp. 399]
MTDFNPTLLTGPLLLGHIFNSFLYGIELMQFSRYWTVFPDDKPWTRRLVYTVIVLDTLQSGFAIHNAWRILGSGWGNQNLVLHPEWSWGSVPLFTGLAAAQCACGVASGVYYAFGAFTGAGHTIAALNTVWLGGTALCDLIITTAIVSFLLIKIAGFKPTDNVVSKVIKMTVETGALTTSFATADLILFLLFPATNLHLIFCIPLAKLYSNTLLAMLNARKGTFLHDTSGAGPSLPLSIHQPAKSQSQSTVNSIIDISVKPPIQTVPLPTKGTVVGSFEKQSHQAKVNTTTTSPSREHVLAPPLPAFAKHGRNRSKQRLTESSKSTDHAARPTKAQANADFDSGLPSILDLSVDKSFRARFLNKFS